MARPRVTVVGLGPADEDQLAPLARRLLTERPRDSVLRTSQHPAAASLGDLYSYDHLYEGAATFEEVYGTIVEDLLRRADASGSVVYGVPGSPLVAERTVEILRGRSDIELVVVPALSFLDLVIAELGLDAMTTELRVVDALSVGDRLRGPGPIVLAQCHSTEVLSNIKLSIDADLLSARPTAVILHHLGLDDQHVVTVDIDDLDRFRDADHLTSVLIPELRTVGPAAEDLVDLMARLRAECPWDQKQTHGSLTRHLLEEAYETLESLEALVEALADGGDEEAVDAAYEHVAEELGDLLFQVVFHAHLAAEDGRFDLAQVMDGVRTKLIGRHPHVFGDVEAETADEVATNWEVIKQAEKGRSSVTEGIPVALPALQRYVKLRRKASALGIAAPTPEDSASRASHAAHSASTAFSADTDHGDAVGSGPAAEDVADVLAAAAELAAALGVDPEAVLRRRADALTSAIVEHESTGG